jgi:integrase/recombinase XerD
MRNEPLRNVLADYLSMRRALGYKMDQVERRLRQFIAFAEDHGETHVRTVDGAGLGNASSWR